MGRITLLVLVLAFPLYAGEHAPDAVQDTPEDSPKQAGFPCDLTKGVNPPFRLIQLGNKAEETLVRELLPKGAFGDIYFAFENPRGGSIPDFIKKEVPDADPAKATLFSSDDGFVPGFLESTAQYANSHRVLQALKGHRAVPLKGKREKAAMQETLSQLSSALEQVKVRAVGGIRGNRFFNDAWASMDRSAFSKEATALASGIDRLVQKRDDAEAFGKVLSELVKSPVWASETGWLEVSRTLAQSFGLVAKADRAAHGLSDLSSFEALMKDPQSDVKEGEFFEKIITEKGIKAQATRLMALYCKAKEAGKEFHAATNAAYFEPMSQILQEAAIGAKDAQGNSMMRFRWEGHDFIVREGVTIDISPEDPLPDVFDPTEIPVEPAKPVKIDDPTPKPAPVP